MFIKREEKTLEDFMINRFGKELYLTFFKDYTYKVWGKGPSEIPADWGAQRIKGVSIKKVLASAIKKFFSGKNNNNIEQKNVETSLIEHFFYPKFGPGHFWETAAEEIERLGGKIIFQQNVFKIETDNGKVVKVCAKDEKDNIFQYSADFFISTMPVKDLIESFDKKDEETANIAKGLSYRDFMTVGLLLKNIELKNNTNIASYKNITPDLWIYIQERDVKIGRLQIFNNWSPYLVDDFENTVWIGLEYFCLEGDKFWNMQDEHFMDFAADELEKICIIKKENILDRCLVRVKKAYPAYFGTYKQFDVIKKFTDKYKNLFLVGRNGMHRYNNMDHSMLAAITAVDNIIKGIESKDNIWQVNTDADYHEEK
jgi:protoporphyrinogen oxidase